MVGETPGPGEEVAIYYVAVIELDPKWEKNNEGQLDFKTALDERVKWGITFRGEVRKSALMSDISQLKVGNERKERGGR